jgi:hypothetical protein
LEVATAGPATRSLRGATSMIGGKALRLEISDPSNWPINREKVRNPKIRRRTPAVATRTARGHLSSAKPASSSSGLTHSQDRKIVRTCSRASRPSGLRLPCRPWLTSRGARGRRLRVSLASRYDALVRGRAGAPRSVRRAPRSSPESFFDLALLDPRRLARGRATARFYRVD